MKYFRTFMIAVSASFFSFNLMAADDKLYETPPPGSAFVRVFNLQADKAIGSVNLGKKHFQQIAPGSTSDFVFVDAKKNTLVIDKVDMPMTLQEGKFHTLVFDGKSLRSVDIEPLKDKRKGLIHMVNLTAKPLDLKTFKGDVAVVSGVNSFASGERAINPVKIAFSAYAGTTRLLETSEIYLDRGRSGSLFVYEINGAVNYFWTEDNLAAAK